MYYDLCCTIRIIIQSGQRSGPIQHEKYTLIKFIYTHNSLFVGTSVFICFM